MKQYIIISALLLVTALMSSCTPDSPEMSADEFLEVDNPMTYWVNGINKEMALAVGTFAELLDVATDNYRNVYSRSNREFDKPNIQYTDIDVENLQRHVGKLREMSLYALNTIAARDIPTDEQLADIYTALAYSYILAGENFVALPMEENGRPMVWQEHLRKAVEVLEEANAKVGLASFKPVCHTLLARAYHRLGNRLAAKENAEKALSYDKTFCAMVDFDEANGVVSNIKDRSFSANWWEPLPRLDFLDPKYQQSAESQRIAYAKAEENYLILAECCAADGASVEDFKEAFMDDFFRLVMSRGAQSFEDNLEMREATAVDGTVVNLNTSDWKVRASSEDEYFEGLVLNRSKGLITVPAVSGTSVDANRMRNAFGRDFLELVYLLRQEVFFAEGRRFSDLGMRLPLCEVEAAKVRNRYPDVDVSMFIKAYIPAYLPTEQYGMDAYTVDAADRTVTIKYNLNRLIVDSHATAFE
ncbi:hypothetical protein E5358_14260 [Palleniella muris]|uniref:Uncharacterized protein n=1 Tax=Palleniella muris TaxID=3038145 RepID=A0AC61QLU2_9BACT|nr:hypothetical protein [Palleniella muris]TGX79907.1 hypothetical protein E5358_14260 [Palleniella muris]